MNDLTRPPLIDVADPMAGPGASAASATRRQHERAEREHNKLRKRLLRLTGQAIGDFNMIEAGDRVMVCLSGGKDSYGLLDVLMQLRERAPIDFELIAVNLDQKQPDFPAHVLPEYLRALGVPFHIEDQDTYSIVKRLVPEGKTLCSLCSRLRRGILYRVADELGATKIALGHHRDDIMETFFLNMFYGGRLKGMPAKLVSDDGRHVVIRPLAYVPEHDLEAYAQWRGFPIIPCNLCGSQDNLKRQAIKQWLRDWSQRFPGRIDNMFASLGRVVPSHLMDRELFGFAALQTTGVPDPDGDIAFDGAADLDEHLAAVAASQAPVGFAAPVQPADDVPTASSPPTTASPAPTTTTRPLHWLRPAPSAAATAAAAAAGHDDAASGGSARGG